MSPTPSTVDPQLKVELGNLFQSVARKFKQVSHSDPQMDEELKQRLNTMLQAEKFNGALIPDEVCRGAADLLCAHLHAIGELFRTAGFVSPAIIAPQARTILENSALIHFLCDCDDQLRIARAMKTLKEKMQKEHADQNPRFSDFYLELSKAVASNGPLNRGKRVKTGEYTELIAREFGDIQGSELYAAFSGLSHHNAWVGYVHEYNVNHFPTDLELEAIDLSANVLVIVLLTLRQLVPHRPQTTEDQVQNIQLLYLQLTILCQKLFN